MILQRQRRAATQAAFVLPLLREDARILDCGCGTGSITNDFAVLAPNGYAIGIDIAEMQCRIARLAAREAKIRNVFYEVQDATCLEFSDDTFDVVFAHALIDHLRDPAKAVSEMMRVLRPGGQIAIRAGDWTRLRMTPACAPAERCVFRYVERIRECGGNPAIGEQLHKFLEALGLDNIRIGLSTESYNRPALFARALSAAVLNDTAIADEESNLEHSDRTCCACLMSWAALPDAVLEETWIEVMGTKPKKVQTQE